MKKIFLILLMQITLNAHTVLINSIDNEDGTMEIVGMFSTGATTQGAMLKLQSLAKKEIIFQDRVPASGSVIVDIPKEPYSIILDCGPGHIIKKEGTIEPSEGFSKTVEYTHINFAFYITLFLSLGFVFLALMTHFLRAKKKVVF